MLFFLLGIAALIAVLAALGMFSRAKIANAKSFAIWAAAIGGLLLTVMLFLTGRGAIAMSALLLLGPLVWSWVVQAKPKFTKPTGPMGREEAFEILGLAPGCLLYTSPSPRD
jgi:amino acid transporter